MYLTRKARVLSYHPFAPFDHPKALDQILTQLAENSTAGRPVPATEEIIANLPRDVLTEGCMCLRILPIHLPC